MSAAPTVPFGFYFDFLSESLSFFELLKEVGMTRPWGQVPSKATSGAASLKVATVSSGTDPKSKHLWSGWWCHRVQSMVTRVEEQTADFTPRCVLERERRL